ncbi:hypothetical protein ACSMXM_09685 [Pacificimonas sp. ICDLI1SI03]
MKTPSRTPLALEYAIRDMIGKFKDPIEINNKLIAQTLSEVALNEQLEGKERALLVSLARCFEGDDEGFQLRIKSKRRGPQKLLHDHLAEFRRHMEISQFVEILMAEGGKKEAAVAEAQAQFSLSRAKIFDALEDVKSAREMRTIVMKIQNENPEIFQKS